MTPSSETNAAPMILRGMAQALSACRTAASIAATSILCIVIIASNARLAVSPPAAIAQIVDSLLTLMDQHEPHWASPAATAPLDAFGQPGLVARDAHRNDGLPQLTHFVHAFPALRSQWRLILHPHTFAEIETFHAAVKDGNSNASLTDAAWVRIVYEMAAAWKLRLLPRAHVIGLLIPLFLARAGSFTMKTQWREQAEIDAGLNHLSEYFSALQPVLHRLWNGHAVAA